MTLLSLRNVDAYYGRAQVLHDVSVEIAAGERVAVLGRNGVGKTTIVNACLGIASVRRGEIAFGGRVFATIRHFTAARHGIAVVPQGRRIVPGLTVRENLLLGAAVGRKGAWSGGERSRSAGGCLPRSAISPPRATASPWCRRGAGSFRA